MNQKKSAQSFEDFLSYFPKIYLPITLTEESFFEFSKTNKPFSGQILQEFVVPLDGEDIDEYTEYHPCLRISDISEFHALIYWCGKLMQYEYILATFTKEGKLISKKSIAGTRSTQDQVIRTVATIDSDWIIHIIVGSQDAIEKTYDASRSKAMSMEMLATGDIIFSLQE